MSMATPSAPGPPMPPGSPRGELGWIEWIRRRVEPGWPYPALTLGIGDDCAVLRPPEGHDLVVTTDFTLEGRHFHRDWHPPESAGHRTLARGLSDLAAMGATPLAAFLSLALPHGATLETAWTERFLEGLLALAERAGVTLAGGDTSESPSGQLLADIVLLGSVPRGSALRRSGARAADGLYVSGWLGGAAAELRFLQTVELQSGRDLKNHPQLFPEPRLRVGEELRRSGIATACMDLSDGLSTDLDHLCRASDLQAVVRLEGLPASPWLQRFPFAEREALLLHGGEDYELLFTASPETTVPAEIEGVPITRIGDMLARGNGDSAVILQRNGRDEPLAPGGWEHLR